MKFNLNFGYDKLHLKEVTILIPKYHPNLASFLTPVLGLYGINVREFIKDFEEKTRFINFDIVVPTRVKISKIKTYHISIKTPYLIPILSNVGESSSINVLTLYKLTMLKSITFGNYRSSFTRELYIFIRRYISNTLRLTPLMSITPSSLNIFSTPVELFFLKNNVKYLLLFKKVIYNKFGIFFSFSSFTNRYLDHLKNLLSLFGANIFRIRAKFFNSLTARDFFSNYVYYLSSFKLSNLTTFLSESALEATPGFFVLYYRFNSNLLTPAFFRLLLDSFRSLSGGICLLRALVFRQSRLPKLLFNQNFSLLKLLSYANLSPAFKESQEEKNPY